jgi:hypothetical protein
MPQEQEAFVWLFRAVSRAELDDIADFGGFRQKPDRLSYEGKLFATSTEDAAAFGRINYRLDLSIGRDQPFYIVEASIPSSLVRQFESQTVDFMPAVYVPEEMLSLVNQHVTVREILAIPWKRE